MTDIKEDKEHHMLAARVDAGFMQRVDAFRKPHNVTRSQLIILALETLMSSGFSTALPVLNGVGELESRLDAIERLLGIQPPLDESASDGMETIVVTPSPVQTLRNNLPPAMIAHMQRLGQ
ncbi:hypothetical protein EAN04_24615 [Salmonella enterica]|nr:hypothetical protein [Salmonella enterica]